MQLAAQGPQGGFLPGKGVGHLRADRQLIPPLTAVIPAQSGEGKQQGIELLLGKVVTINGDIADGGITGKGLSCGIHDLPAGRRGLLGDGNALGRLAGVVLAIPQLGQHHHHHKKQKNGADGSAQDDIAFSLVTPASGYRNKNSTSRQKNAAISTAAIIMGRLDCK